MNITNVDLTTAHQSAAAAEPPAPIALDGRQAEGDFFADYPTLRPHHEPEPDNNQQDQQDQQNNDSPQATPDSDPPDQPPPEHHHHKHHQDQQDQQNNDAPPPVVPDSEPPPDQAPPEHHNRHQQDQDESNDAPQVVVSDPDSSPDQTPPVHHHKHQQDQDQQNTETPPQVNPNTPAPDNHQHQEQDPPTDTSTPTPPPHDTGHDEMVGDPNADSHWWSLQHADDTCAVVSQLGIIESITGHQMSQEELVRVAYQHGWYSPGEGTSWDCVGNLLEYYGIPVERLHDCSLTTLSDALASGHKIIVGVDGEEIWRPVHDDNGDPMKIPGGADHAIWVTGIETDADGSVFVIVNDSGTADGRSERVPVADFLNAWQDSNNFAVITENPTTTQTT